MGQDTKSGWERQAQEARTALEEILREGARRMLGLAIEAEVADYIEAHRHIVEEATGRRLVVRNGRLPGREIQTGLGPVPVSQPRVNDRREGRKFTSCILPPYLRRLPSIEALIAVLYLKGVSTNDFPEALHAILGENAAGLSPTSIVRLKEAWRGEYEAWATRDLTGRRYVYFWADGIYFTVRLTDERPCLLVIMGAAEDGTKELVGLWDGERESRLSWLELLRDLKRRGLQVSPKLCVGDGALGFWAALPEVFSEAREQRCWVHKTANVLDKMPKKVQPAAKRLIHEIYMAETKKDALKAFDEFLACYGAKYPKACECLVKDKDVLLTFYDFPAEHWVHLRSTNPIESTFATVRHRTRQTKGCGSRLATLSMVFKLCREAEKHWRRLNGHHLILKVISGVRFEDGLERKAA
jgi:putative transposase